MLKMLLLLDTHQNSIWLFLVSYLDASSQSIASSQATILMWKSEMGFWNSIPEIFSALFNLIDKVILLIFFYSKLLK